MSKWKPLCEIVAVGSLLGAADADVRFGNDLEREVIGRRERERNTAVEDEAGERIEISVGVGIRRLERAAEEREADAGVDTDHRG